MAELEMIQHMKKSVGALTRKGHSPWEKVKEFSTEIFIIVFAVTLSIWLHEWAEHRHRQAEARVFLQELYKDLDYDRKHYVAEAADFRKTLAGYRYLSSLKHGTVAAADSIRIYEPYFRKRYIPVPTQGRYESFKYSAKMAQIENDALEGDIFDLFEEDVALLHLHALRYGRLQEQLGDYLVNNIRRTGKGADNRLQVYSGDVAVGYSRELSDGAAIQAAYDQCIAKIGRVNAAIAVQLGDEAPGKSH